MSIRAETMCFASIAIAAILAVNSTLAAAQSSMTKHAHHAGNAPNIYESDEIMLRIPVDWRISQGSGGDRRDGIVMLERSGYRLSLAYHTDHASGIEGGRFVEAFSMGWAGLEDAWTCSGYLREFPQLASRQLIFINLILDTGDARVRENCAIPK